MNRKLLHVFIGSDGWRCLLTDGKTRIRSITFNSGPEEHIRSFLRGLSIKKAFIILSSESSIFRFSKLPLLKSNEFKKALPFLYESSFPVDKDKYIFDYKILAKDSEKCRLFLAALPSKAAADIINVFNGMGIKIDRLGLFEGIGGSSLSQFTSILVFINQVSSWRVICMKNKAPIDTCRVAEPNDLISLFAELDYGEMIDHALFYSKPEDWLIIACKEYGLTVTEALDFNDIFNECDDSVNLLPASYKRVSLYRGISGMASITLIILASMLFSVSFLLKNGTENLRMRHTELSAQIRSINSELKNYPELPSEFKATQSVYGHVMKVLTDQLPPGIRISYACSEDNALKLLVSSDDSEWLNHYVNTCRSSLNMDIITSKISQGEGVMEIELIIELR